MEELGDVEEDWVDGLARPMLRVAMFILSVFGFVVVTLPMSRWWLWVARSAFTGDRAEADFTLGVVSVLVAVVPLLCGCAAWLVRRRQPGSKLMQISAGLALSVMLAVPGLLYAVVATFP